MSIFALLVFIIGIYCICCILYLAVILSYFIYSYKKEEKDEK